MVENTRSVGSNGPPIEFIDGDINVSDFTHYRFARSRQPEADHGPDEPAPLFLSQPADEYLFENGLRPWSLAPPRSLTVRICSVSLATIGLAMISIDAARNLAAHVTASVAGLSAVQAREQTAVTVKRHVDRAPTDRPSPAEIATAYQEAIKHQVMARDVPQARPAAAPPPRRLDPDERSALLQRAQSLLAAGDVASARLLLERAADAQEAEAALLLARTYDTEAMGAPDARVIATDAAKARAWYRKAAEFGSLRAQQRLAQMRD